MMMLMMTMMHDDDGDGEVDHDKDDGVDAHDMDVDGGKRRTVRTNLGTRITIRRKRIRNEGELWSRRRRR